MAYREAREQRRRERLCRAPRSFEDIAPPPPMPVVEIPPITPKQKQAQETFIAKFELDGVVRDFRAENPSQPELIFNLEGKKGKKRIASAKAREEAMKLVEVVKEQEEKQMATAEEYMKDVEAKSKMMQSKWFRPKTCAKMYEFAITHADKFINYNMDHEELRTPKEQEEFGEELDYRKGMAQSWYKQARAYEEGIFHVLRHCTNQLGDAPPQYDPRDFDKISLQRYRAESHIQEAFGINLKELKVNPGAF